VDVVGVVGGGIGVVIVVVVEREQRVC